MISRQEFRNALGLFPTGVVVMTAMTPHGEALGITVNSFASVSLEPPLISFILANSLRSFRAFKRIEAFAVNLLREDQTDISERLAHAGTDKWGKVARRGGVTMAPILQPNLAVFECNTYAEHEAGDHLIVVGRVLSVETTSAASPLVFFRGGYCGVRPAPC